MKKGQQVIGQIFIYILAALLFTLILGYGYRAIGNFIDRSEEVALLELRTRLISEIDTISSSRDEKTLTLNMPKGVREVCFFDTEYNIDNPDLRRTKTICKEPQIPGETPSEDYHPLLCDNWVDNVPQNVFFLPRTDIAITVNALEPMDATGAKDGYVCIPSREEKLYLRLQGRGDRTRIFEWLRE